MCTIFRANTKPLRTKGPTNNSFVVAFDFQEIGIIFSLKMVPKHVVEARLMFVLIKNLYLVGTIKLYIDIKNVRDGQL